MPKQRDTRRDYHGQAQHQQHLHNHLQLRYHGRPGEHGGEHGLPGRGRAGAPHRQRAPVLFLRSSRRVHSGLHVGDLPAGGTGHRARLGQPRAERGRQRPGRRHDGLSVADPPPRAGARGEGSEPRVEGRLRRRPRSRDSRAQRASAALRPQPALRPGPDRGDAPELPPRARGLVRDGQGAERPRGPAGPRLRPQRRRRAPGSRERQRLREGLRDLRGRHRHGPGPRRNGRLHGREGQRLRDLRRESLPRPLQRARGRLGRRFDHRRRAASRGREALVAHPQPDRGAPPRRCPQVATTSSRTSLHQ
jgi:hypothetical protein